LKKRQAGGLSTLKNCKHVLYPVYTISLLNYRGLTCAFRSLAAIHSLFTAPRHQQGIAWHESGTVRVSLLLVQDSDRRPEQQDALEKAQEMIRKTTRPPSFPQAAPPPAWWSPFFTPVSHGRMLPPGFPPPLPPSYIFLILALPSASSPTSVISRLRLFHWCSKQLELGLAWKG
jgi:hypothetical protein